MNDNEHNYYKKKQERGWSVIRVAIKYLPFLFFLALILYLLTGCEIANDFGKRSIVTMPLNNQANCTPAEVRDANGKYLGTIPAHKMGTVQASRSIFDDPQDRTFISFQTPDHIIDEILSGNPESVIPRGCDDWGYGDERIRLKNGYETDTGKIRLRPPDYWDEPDNW